MDAVLSVIRKRRSVRDFEPDEIPKEIVSRLIEAILWAPSAGNLQSRKFYFITSKYVKRDLARAALNQSFIAEAPLVAVGCADRRVERRYGERGVNLYAIQDVACSIMSLMLVAAENGLGSVWVGAFKENEVAAVLGLPQHLRPVAIVPIGRPSRMPQAPPRIPAEEAVEFM